MHLPCLYAIVNTDGHKNLLNYCNCLLSSGITLIQLRSKTTPDEQLCKQVDLVLNLRNNLSLNSQIIINDRLKVALKTGADGLHLGQDDMSPTIARETLGPNKIIGFSTHTKEQIRSAPQNILDYLALGPIFPSPTKSGHAEEVGLSQLRNWRQFSTLPLVAIGGITAQNALSVYQAGANTIAVISDLQTTSNIPERISQYYNAFKNSNESISTI